MRRQLAFVVGLAAALFEAAAYAGPQPANPLTPSGRSLELVPIISDERLEFIEESLDGTRLLTHDQGFSPRLWDPKSMRILRILSGHSDPVAHAFLSDDGKLILTQSYNKIMIWDSVRGRPMHSIPHVGDEGFVEAAFSPDGKRLAAGTQQGVLLLSDSSGNKNTLRINAFKEWISHVSFSADGRYVVASGVDKTAKVFSAQDGKEVAMLAGHTASVWWGWFSQDGKQLITTAIDNTCRVYSTTDWKFQFAVPHYIGDKSFLKNTMMSALFVGKDEKYLLTCDKDGTMQLRDRRLGTIVGALKGHTDTIREIRRSKDGLRVATYGTDEQLKIWDVEGSKEYPYERPADGPTAGEFNAAGTAFWIGYSNGSIRRHVLETGAVRNIAYGSARAMLDFKVIDDEHFWVRPDLDKYVEDQNAYVVSGEAAGSRSEYPYGLNMATIDPLGKFAFVQASGWTAYPLLDAKTGRFIMAYKNVSSSGFSGDGSKLVTTHSDDYSILSWNSASGEMVNGLKFTTEAYQGDFKIEAVSLDGLFVATSGHKDDMLHVWDMDKRVSIMDMKGPSQEKETLLAAAFMHNTKQVALLRENDIAIVQYPDFKIVKDLSLEKRILFAPGLQFSPDDKYLLVNNFSNGTSVFRMSDGEEVIYVDGSWTKSDSINFSADSKRVLINRGTEVDVYDLESGKPVMVIRVPAPGSPSFNRTGTRILVNDAIGGLSIWDSVAPSPDKKGEVPLAKKLGAYMTQDDGGWLVMDSEGRYDASDPSNVTSASFVLEWEGGLEPISISQLKAQFYEPGLLGMLLGTSKEKPRTVPLLDSLRLFPDVKVEQSKRVPTRYSIELYERDNGGVGTASVFINGKLVLKKQNTGVFDVDAKDYEQFLLPEAALDRKHGETNTMTVTASNAKGDLTSAPLKIDLGVPAGLKAPEVNLFALFVGAGDYVGSQGDLTAPPSDAHALRDALTLVSKGLLGDRINVSVMTTDTGEERPSRTNIRKWFEDVAKRAKATDIVVAYFSGHGTNSIGDKKGYFFLTPDINPKEIAAGVLDVGTVSGEDLSSWLREVPAGKQVVILDTCHSGAAASELMALSRSVSGDYQRAYESLKDSSGTWLLAGSAADQASFESSSVDHGMLTYSLLEAIDKATPAGLRPGASGDLFVDVEQWLRYAADRVESLKNEVGIRGVQKPEFKRSGNSRTFDIGVTNTGNRGKLGLKPPRPVVIVSSFSMEEEDPLSLEPAIAAAFKGSEAVKAWFDVAKHPNVYRVAGTYVVAGETVKVRVILQAFDSEQARKTLESFEVTGTKAKLGDLAGQIRQGIEERVKKLEDARAKPPTSGL